MILNQQKRATMNKKSNNKKRAVDLNKKNIIIY